MRSSTDEGKKFALDYLGSLVEWANTSATMRRHSGKGERKLFDHIIGHLGELRQTFAGDRPHVIANVKDGKLSASNEKDFSAG